MLSFYGDSQRNTKPVDLIMRCTASCQLHLNHAESDRYIEFYMYHRHLSTVDGTLKWAEVGIFSYFVNDCPGCQSRYVADLAVSFHVTSI